MDIREHMMKLAEEKGYVLVAEIQDEMIFEKKKDNGMKINAPCIITSRLLPGLKIGNGFISIEYVAHSYTSDGRTVYRYYVDIDGKEYSGSSLKSGYQGGNLQRGLSSLLSFLQHSAELWNAGITEVNFPGWVCEWAYQHSDEIQMIQIELDINNNNDVIVE